MTAETRKRILRTALHEIIVRIEGGFIEMVLHWQGGDHTGVQLNGIGVGKRRWTVPEDTLSLIRELARLMPNQQMAATGYAPDRARQQLTKARVCSFRSHHGIAVYRDESRAEEHNTSGDGANHRRERDDGAAHDPTRHHQGVPALQGCAAWVMKRETGRGCCASRKRRATRWFECLCAAEPSVSMT